VVIKLRLNYLPNIECKKQLVFQVNIGFNPVEHSL
jgi:hypothetical protein